MKAPAPTSTIQTTSVTIGHGVAVRESTSPATAASPVIPVASVTVAETAETGCVPIAAGTPCPDDGDPCTQALCDGGGRCVERPVTGPETDLCRIGLCQKPRLRTRLDRLAVQIRSTLAAGKTPRARKLSRVGRLLRRCGVGRPAS